MSSTPTATRPARTPRPVPADASIVRVAVPVPLAGVFDYTLPRGSVAGVDMRPGSRVEVQFGRRRLTGVIMGFSQHSEVAADKLRPINRVLDIEACLDEPVLELLKWCSSYYQHPLGEVVNAALTTRLRQGKPATAATSLAWTAAGTEPQDAAEQLARAPRQAQLFALLQQHGSLRAAQLNELTANWRAAMQALVDKGLVDQQRVEVLSANPEPASGPELLGQQQDVIAAIVPTLASSTVHLLHGITGSGKTEIYIRLAQQVLDTGRQVLLLVPEISLTPQLTSRFRERLGVAVGILHSGLGDTERHNIWVAAAGGECRLLIGTRSAVFTPLPDLGLVIIDEEHDGSFKQQDGFRYHARDVALVRARDAGIPVVAGSATPSLESLYNARLGRYRYHRLTQRAASRHQTATSLIDMRSQPVIEGISDSLLRKARAHLEQGNQVMFFLNRRGYAPLLLCHQCGWTTRCKRCDAHMTYHQHSKRLRCHHCDSEMPAPASCAECGSDELIALGSGTERIEQALAQQFDGVNVCRIDRDTTRQKGALEQKLDSVHSGEVRVLVGTQMLAKGHDFPNVTLVGILDTDQALYSADFRAPEHLAQLVIQVSGRAGRAGKAGEVLIQTHHPDHPLLQTLLHQGYEAFCDAALAEREAAMLPPYSHMVLLRCEAGAAETAFAFLYIARDILRRDADDSVSIFGPVTAPMEKRAGRYRCQLMLQSTERRPLHLCLRRALPQIQELQEARKVRWSIDVDPVDTF